MNQDPSGTGRMPSLAVAFAWLDDRAAYEALLQADPSGASYRRLLTATLADGVDLGAIAMTAIRLG